MYPHNENPSDKLLREVLPLRTSAIPNHDGTLALYKSWRDQELRVMNIALGNSRVLINQFVSHATWLGDGSNTVIFVRRDGSIYELFSIDADASSGEPNRLGWIPGKVNGLRIKCLQDGSIAFAILFAGTGDNTLSECSPILTDPSMRCYDNYRVQEVDTYVKSGRYSIFYSTLAKKKGRWAIAGPVYNALPYTNLEALAYDRGDATEYYDISQRGIAVTAAKTGSTDPTAIYYIRIDSYAAACVHKPVKITAEDQYTGKHCSNPRFSPDGSLIAFLVLGPERNPIHIHQLEASNATRTFNLAISKEWLPTPSEFEFAPNGHALYFTAQDAGRTGLYKLDLRSNTDPSTVLRNGTVKAFYPLSEGNSERLLVTSSSLVESSLYQIVHTNGGHEPITVSATQNGVKLGLSQKQVSEIYFKGGGDYNVHGWMFRPSQFDEGRNYPLAILVHGGPRDAWRDEWKTNVWNPMVWAEQGYVVVTPNITGSEGYGLEFEEAVRDNWGGRPYEDLIKCMEYLEGIPNVDTHKAVIAGVSYGGYMMNWIQGHPFARRFKAMVCCNGMFDLPTHMLQCDFPLGYDEFGGSWKMWENLDGLQRYNPARVDLLPNWKTPMLVVHGGKDYRCPLTDGLAAFHTLKALETPSRFVVFPEEGHGVEEENNIVNCFREIFNWINRYTEITDHGGDSETENSEQEDSGIKDPDFSDQLS
ncbi:prolyl oligopeptidase [Hypoxylon sp. FL0890]|nr:prolyl oligopeptidase [Hypoxylon sp. FL0890]